ncbi:MAG: P-loop NTPase [Alphaproteobacteria bacterium]|nr:P-loop NTPase [Alphaproteobacteria bacterium]MCB9929193.1 P-loop NTPase [Alphaproteobacteria bacterium]
MSLIEKAAERFEKERSARARGRTPTPHPGAATVPTGDASADAMATGGVTDVPPVAPPVASAPTPTPTPAPTPSAGDAGDAPLPRGPVAESAARPASGFPARHSEASVSQTFRINFKQMEKHGFVSRPFGRERLAKDLRLMKHRLMNRMNFFSLDAHRSTGRQQNVIMVTSSLASEGKTFTAANLAMSLALEDRVSVLLVDADVIRPSVQSIFGLTMREGLTDYLRMRETDLSPYLWRAENAPLSLLLAGSPVQAPRELFRSDEMSRFIFDVSNRYRDRLVIFDTPPLLVTAEAPVLSNHADQIVMVVQAGRTPQTTVEGALELLPAHDNVSLVLNRCNESERMTTPDYYGYGYYQVSAEIEDARPQS